MAKDRIKTRQEPEQELAEVKRYYNRITSWWYVLLMIPTNLDAKLLYDVDVEHAEEDIKRLESLLSAYKTNQSA